MAIDARVQKVIQRAEELANLRPDLQIDTSHLLMAICAEADGVSAQILQSFGITPEQLQIVLLDLRATHQAAAPQATTTRSATWEERVEQQLTRIESELAAIRSLLTPPNSSDTV